MNYSRPTPPGVTKEMNPAGGSRGHAGDLHGAQLAGVGLRATGTRRRFWDVSLADAELS